MEKVIRIIFPILNCTWGIIQTVVGGIVFLVNIRSRHYIYKGVVVTEWPLLSGVSLGVFVFVPRRGESNSSEKAYWENVLHEYGHTVQSVILGPLYMLIIGAPSIIWCQFFGGMRRRSGISYYTFFTEKWANYLTEKVIGEKVE